MITLHIGGGFVIGVVAVVFLLVYWLQKSLPEWFNQQRVDRTATVLEDAFIRIASRVLVRLLKEPEINVAMSSLIAAGINKWSKLRICFVDDNSR